MLDVGASIGADARALVDMAVMGAAMARIVLGVERPTVGLLNVGVEEVKGLEMVREAGRILREADLPSLDYLGFVEGDDIGKGTADVVVTEGFAGNIALKTAEGTAKQIAGYLRAAMSRTLMATHRLSLRQGRLRSACARSWTPARSMAGCFSASTVSWSRAMAARMPKGYAAAIDLAYDMVKQDLMRQNHRKPHASTIAPAAAARRRCGRGLMATLRSVVRGVGSYLPANARHATRNWPRSSTPPTNGSSSAPASGSAISRPKAR